MRHLLTRALPARVAVAAAVVALGATGCSDAGADDGQSPIFGGSDNGTPTDNGNVTPPVDASDDGAPPADDGGDAVTPPPDQTSQTYCEPGAWSCSKGTERALCNTDGSDYAELQDCAEGTGCVAATATCEAQICTPYERVCTDAASYHICLDSGTGWADETVTCEGNHSCAGGSCILDDCLQRILLLVDTSGSMGASWLEAQSSIDSLFTFNPSAFYGLATFPVNGTECSIQASPKIAIGDGSADQIHNWFDSNPPFGKTPLLAALEAQLGIAGSTFGGKPGALIVLSDGTDSCAHSEIANPSDRNEAIVADLAIASTALSEQHEIKVYVIGYKVAQGLGQLDAIAANGGTGHTEHTSAGNEAELQNALHAVVTDFKLCL